MSAAAAITLNDGQATPVAVTFNPVRVKDDLVVYQNTSAATILEREQITLSNRLPNGANGNYKATFRVRIPVPETLSTDSNGYTAQPKEAYALTFDCSVVIPNRASSDEISDLIAFAQNGLAHAVVEGLMDTSDGLPY
jgi:hypothetical protein